jgi:hypothetical protein
VWSRLSAALLVESSVLLVVFVRDDEALSVE